MSRRHGLLECVDGVRPIKDLLALELMPDAKDRLVSSGACSFIAGYVLGLRDRHHDNLLVTEAGELFHIDFGFIGKDQPFLDTHPFPITQELVAVLGDNRWNAMVGLAVKAFDVLREHAHEIVNFAGACLQPVLSRTKVQELIRYVVWRYVFSN